MAKLDPECLLFVDEMGITTSLTRLYARAVGGKRALGKAPRNYGDNVSVIGAIRLRGIVSTMSIGGAVDGLVFEAFLAHMLAPKLKSGDVVLMDKLNVHRSDLVEKLIKSAKGRLLYLPPYSPDFSPMENCWSKVKEFLRAAGARTRKELDQALAHALESITCHDIRGWFKHCGY